MSRNQGMCHVNYSGVTMKKKVLIVDDNAFLRRLMEVSLTPDYEVVEATSHDSAWSKMCEATPDLTFVDIELNDGMGGLALLKAMRCDERFRLIPVGVVSARALSQDKQNAKDSGANAYLTKPFSAKQLKDLAQTLLGERPRDTGLVEP